jgi:hypothetical protein
LLPEDGSVHADGEQRLRRYHIGPRVRLGDYRAPTCCCHTSRLLTLCGLGPVSLPIFNNAWLDTVDAQAFRAGQTHKSKHQHKLPSKSPEERKHRNRTDAEAEPIQTIFATATSKSTCHSLHTGRMEEGHLGSQETAHEQEIPGMLGKVR